MALHHTTKKAAVKKYTDLAAGKSAEELKALIESDEKGYSPEDVEEILQSVTTENKPPVVEVNPYGKKEYQEWEVKINGGKAEKLKVSRQKVKITDEQADILNAGVESGGNTYAKMYFLPENN